MVNNFARKDLIGSLCCPFLTLCWGIIRSIVDFSWGATFIGSGAFRLVCFPAILVGGLLCALLTIGLKIHTERYVKKRIIVIGLVLLANNCIGMIGKPLVMFSLYMLVDIGAIIYQVLKVQDEETLGKERIVMLLSDPIVYWTIYWFIFWFIFYLEI